MKQISNIREKKSAKTSVDNYNSCLASFTYREELLVVYVYSSVFLCSITSEILKIQLTRKNAKIDLSFL